MARKSVHDGKVYFRMADNLLAAAESKAEQRGMSLSEYMRDVVRRDVLTDR